MPELLPPEPSSVSDMSTTSTLAASANNSNKLSNLPPAITNSYTVYVGEQMFRLYRSSIIFDSPNFFTQSFLRDEVDDLNKKSNNGSDDNEEERDGVAGRAYSTETPTTNVMDNIDVSTQTTPDTLTTVPVVRELKIDRDPRLFEVILRYLRGYNIFPLSSVNLPPGMSLDLFRESLLEDARFYGLDRLARLLQAETPTPLRYKDPFTSQDKILLSLRDVPIHKEFIKSKLASPSAVEFFTGAVLTIDIDSTDSTIRFHTEILNEQDKKALDTLGDIYGDDTKIKLSRSLTTGWNMRNILNGIRLEIDGVQITGIDVASLLGSFGPRNKTLEDMFRLAGGERLVIYAQEFVFRLEKGRQTASSIADSDAGKGISESVSVHSTGNDGADQANNDENNETIDENTVVTGNSSSLVDGIEDQVFLGVVWAKGWTQEWWAWNEYRMKLDTLQ
ncbi:4395_t:CDS:1 [Paraglomus occultum]|uniref:4395_t:CDS:1 n=1 Tax=Paraglomus occultum TaxID=144539 RepID=A0A9N8YVY6_9GLOM|nr:4395_t:CDS:1 [Paraglomus occultum]